MALAIDSSSPASHTAGSSTPANTCAAFTPPDSPLLLAIWAGDSSSGSTPAAPSAASSPSQGWTRDGWDNQQSGSPSLPGQAAIFHSLVTGSPGSSTVTITNGESTSGSQGSLLKVYAITGHDPVSPIGVVGGGRTNDVASLSDSYIASISGGQGFMVVCDWDAKDSTDWTAINYCTMVDKGTVAGEVSYAVIRRTDPDGVVGNTTTLGLTGLAPIGGKYHWVYVEVISAVAASIAAAAAGLAGSANPPMF